MSPPRVGEVYALQDPASFYRHFEVTAVSKEEVQLRPVERFLGQWEPCRVGNSYGAFWYFLVAFHSRFKLQTPADEDLP